MQMVKHFFIIAFVLIFLCATEEIPYLPNDFGPCLFAQCTLEKRVQIIVLFVGPILHLEGVNFFSQLMDHLAGMGSYGFHTVLELGEGMLETCLHTSHKLVEGGVLGQSERFLEGREKD